MRTPNQHAKALRQNQTTAESLLWELLRARQVSGLKFRRQHTIGPFVADFACRERKIIVELDGESHDHKTEEDRARDQTLRDLGWQVIRFTNEDVISDAE